MLSSILQILVLFIFSNDNTFRRGNDIVIWRLLSSLFKSAFVFIQLSWRICKYTPILCILLLLVTSGIWEGVNQKSGKWNMQQWQRANLSSPQRDQTCDLGLISTTLKASELIIHRLIGPDLFNLLLSFS